MFYFLIDLFIYTPWYYATFSLSYNVIYSCTYVILSSCINPNRQVPNSKFRMGTCWISCCVASDLTRYTFGRATVTAPTSHVYMCTCTQEDR